MPPRRRVSPRLAIVALLLGGLGCAARGTDTPIIEFAGSSGSSSSPTDPSSAESTLLRIATANLWGVSVLGIDWADHIDARFAAMAARLAANDERLDVVLIQEAWKDTARRALLADPGVSENFPHRVDVVERPGGAGLVILSRWPIEEVSFRRYDAQGHCYKFWEGDCLSGKGLAAVRLRLGKHAIWIANTHLIACYAAEGASEASCDREDPNGAARWLQLAEARQSLVTLAGENPILVGGDFNFTRTSRYYASMIGDAGGWREPGEDPPVSERLDYFWTRPGKALRWGTQNRARPIFTEPVVLPTGESVPLSDHPILLWETCLVPADDPSYRCLSAP